MTDFLLEIACFFFVVLASYNLRRKIHFVASNFGAGGKPFSCLALGHRLIVLPHPNFS